MGEDFYIGVENELQLFKGNELLNFEEIFGPLLLSYPFPYFLHSEHTIKTHVGSCLYADDKEPEVCSYPIKVGKGFTQEVADALYLARKELVEFISSDPDLILVGYSTHWNLSDNQDIPLSRLDIMKSLAVPYSLFTLTPLSCGINLREKPNRYELLGDYLQNEEQIKAFLLFYAGSLMGIKEAPKQLPLSISLQSTRQGHLLPQGRETKVQLSENSFQKSHEISAQVYLETYFSHFLPYFESIGSPEEVKNLKDFVEQKKLLEMDKIKTYSSAEFILNLENFKAARQVPTALGRLFGKLAVYNGKVLQPIGKYVLKKLEWDAIAFEKEALSQYEAKGLFQLELLAKVFEK